MKSMDRQLKAEVVMEVVVGVMSVVVVDTEEEGDSMEGVEDS